MARIPFSGPLMVSSTRMWAMLSATVMEVVLKRMAYQEAWMPGVGLNLPPSICPATNTDPA